MRKRWPELLGRPDIILKLTQIINGVPTVIYLDPYTCTRWNTSHPHIDLFLDNETVRCGSHCTPQPEGAAHSTTGLMAVACCSAGYLVMR